MIRATAVCIAGVALGVTLSGCVGSDAISPPHAGENRVGVPAAGALSRSAPQPGPLSTTSPSGGAKGAIAPDAAARTATASAAASALRLLWQNTATGDRSMWVMNGTAYASAVILPNVPTAWTIVGSGDFNADGNPDIVWENLTSGDRSIWFMNGDTWSGTFALLPNVPVQWSIAGVGDFNADGKPDLVWQNMTTGDRSIWFMNGSSYASAALLPSVTTAWRIVAVGDFNADGKSDLVWQRPGTGEGSIWFMNGSAWSGTFALLTTVPTAWRIGAAGDFDGDGDPDLAWQNVTTGERSIWLMNGATFAGAVLLPTVPVQWSIAGVMSPGSTVAGSWVQLGPSISGVTEVAIASDGQSLYRFYCKPLLSDPQDEGELERWTGVSWQSVGNLTHECHHPEVEVEGSLFVAGFADDDPDYGFASNANGPIVIFTGLFLVHQWGMHVAIAQGRPYEAFAAAWSDGKEYPWNMLHVISPIPAGGKAVLNGGWGHYVNYSISNDVAIAGDANAWYAVTRQQNFLFVKKGYYSAATNSGVTVDIADGFSGGGGPVLPEISVYNGQPTVSWLEATQSQIWVARYDGTQWRLLGQGGVESGYIGHIRQDVLGSNLYVMQVNSAGTPRLFITRWDGAEWSDLPDPAVGDTPMSTTGDVAIMNSGPVVAYVTGGVMKVKQLR